LAGRESGPLRLPIDARDDCISELARLSLAARSGRAASGGAVHAIRLEPGDNTMSDAALTTDQARKLLHELSTNGVFRARFEEKPAAALVELGIPHETVINLPAACLAPTRLASEDVLKRSFDELSKNGASLYIQMIPPQFKLSSKA
jgi:putative modified peptide